MTPPGTLLLFLYNAETGAMRPGTALFVFKTSIRDFSSLSSTALEDTRRAFSSSTKHKS